MVRFSIVTVAYNAGNKLRDTVQSVLEQSFSDFEIVIKDGGSTDNSLSLIPEDPRVHVISRKDRGIYDAMNQAVCHVSGEYVLFLNCGDILYNEHILERVNSEIAKDDGRAQMYYGDVFVKSRGGVIRTPEDLTDYWLINKTICHQTIFFQKRIFDICNYEYEAFSLAADMGLYVRCIKEFGMKARHMPFIVVNYEGGGTSETIENKKAIIAQKKAIMKKYYSADACRKVTIMRVVRLKVLKEYISTSKMFFNLYEKVASIKAKAER